MPRPDRLKTLVQHLRDGALHRAEDLAAATGVSLRTIYRDMERLAASGVPVSGERGIGYRITAEITLPPLNLSMTELEALHLGLVAVAQSGEADLVEAARALSAKLDAALPEDGDHSDPFAIGTSVFTDAVTGIQHLPSLRQAIRARQKLLIQSDGIDRTVRPLKLEYWGRVWTVILWCETTRGFDDLRVDRITSLRKLPSLFASEAGKSLQDFRRTI